MKKSTFVAFLLLAFAFTNRANNTSAAFHVENIVLKYFQAKPTPTGAKIVWEFATEEHDVTCNLEKSTDGVNFVSLRSVQLTSTRQQALHSYIDRNSAGQAFYRLRITKPSYDDFISQIVSVRSAQTAANISAPIVIGQPVNSFFGDLSLKSDVMCVRLVDFTGQSKMKQFIKGTELERVFRPSFSNLPAGYYVLNINNLQDQPLMTKCIYKF